MAVELIWYIRFVEVLALILAAALVYLAYGGYRRSRGTFMLSAASGFGMLGMASLLEGVLYEAGWLALDGAHAVRSTLTALGLLILLYSIHKTA